MGDSGDAQGEGFIKWWQRHSAARRARLEGRHLCKEARRILKRKSYRIPAAVAADVRAAIGGKILCRETVKAMGKNVLAKCYGGDISRKRKLLEKQKEGKKRMKRVGRVDIPQEAFLAILKVD